MQKATKHKKVYGIIYKYLMLTLARLTISYLAQYK